MALGNANNYQSNNQNGNQQQNQNPTYYSRLRFKNGNLSLNSSYWNGTLKISISVFSDGKVNELASINLTPNKAKILANGLSKVVEEDTVLCYGIDSGSTEIKNLITVGKDIEGLFILIGKVTPDGKFESAPQRFTFDNNASYILKFNDVENLKFVKEVDNTLEILQFKNLLDDFARSSNGAYGYNCNDINRYEANKLVNLVKNLSNGNNTTKTYNNSYKNNNSGYFGGSNPSNDTNSGDKKNNYKTIDDLEEEFL